MQLFFIIPCSNYIMNPVQRRNLNQRVRRPQILKNFGSSMNKIKKGFINRKKYSATQQKSRPNRNQRVRLSQFERSMNERLERMAIKRREANLKIQIKRNSIEQKKIEDGAIRMINAEAKKSDELTKLIKLVNSGKANRQQLQTFNEVLNNATRKSMETLGIETGDLQ